jgi:threonine dehydrogenase-like Zn-dependent dehydrogenase
MNAYTSKQLWHNQTGQTWFNTENIRKLNLKKDELIVESCYSLISAGTERMILNHPPKGNTARNMRVPYMLGDFDSEFTYGYSLVGEVLEGSLDWIGKYVHVMHPHQSVVVINQKDAFPVPESVSKETATLASNLETVINALWDSGISIGDRVLIIGFGIIGAMLAIVIGHMPGIEITVYEKDPYRRKFCESLKFHTLSEANELCKEYTIAFNTSSSHQGLQIALDNIRNEGLVAELSWYGPKNVILNLGDDFHYGRKKIISSQVSRIPIAKSGFFDLKSRKELVFKLLGNINFDSLIQRKFPFDKAPDVFRSLRKENQKEVGILFHYK